MDSSGVTDVLLEAELVGSGIAHGVTNIYNHAMVCHKTALENLERLLIEKFLEYTGVSKSYDNLLETAKLKLSEMKSSSTKDYI